MTTSQLAAARPIRDPVTDFETVATRSADAVPKPAATKRFWVAINQKAEHVSSTNSGVHHSDSPAPASFGPAPKKSQNRHRIGAGISTSDQPYDVVDPVLY
jgi:hypothetical protein